MAEYITGWRTKDGRIWDTPEKAHLHEDLKAAETKLLSFVESFIMPHHSKHEVVDSLFHHRVELFKLLLEERHAVIKARTLNAPR